jgi:nucleoside-diphosphate-sugar epimerase
MAQGKILVTGGLGFIGHNIVAQLQALGHAMVIVDAVSDYGIIPRDELEGLVRERARLIDQTDLYLTDITDPGLDHIFQDHDIATVIHLASFPRQKVVNRDPVSGSRVMSEGLLNLLELSVAHHVDRFVYVSSSMVYGEFTDDTTEDHPCAPQGQYGIMKLAGEWLTRDYTQRRGMSHVIVRPSAVYGARDVEDRVVSQFMMAAHRGETLRVRGAGECLDFTDVRDTARGIVLAAVTPAAANNTYNITRGRGRSLQEAAEIAVKISGSGTIDVLDRDPLFPSRGALNIDRARRDLSFEPTIDIEQGFEDYYRWITDPIRRSTSSV